MKIIELVIDETADEYAVDCVSLVDEPAIESNWIALKKQRFKKVNEAKRMLMGAVLIPDKMIYRHDDERGDYQVYFSKKTCRQAMELYMSRGFQNSFSKDHETKIEGVHMVESWIVEDKEKDKSALYGFDVPVGTWMCCAKIKDDELWENSIQSGDLLGFSIEGFFVSSQEALALKEIEQVIQNHTKR
jgi:hypothetical protein